MLAPALERGSGCVPGGTGGSMPRQRIHHSRRPPGFPADFPERLVRFKEESDLPWAEIHRRLDVHPETARRWREKGCCPTRRTMRRSCKWRTRWASATCSETEGAARLAGAAGRRVWNAKRPSYTECSASDPHCIPGAALPSWRRPSRRSRNGIELSPRREGKAAMEQAGRRTPVRAAPRSLARPKRPFPQQGNRPVGERQDMQEERHERGA